MSNPLSDNTSSDPAESARTAIGGQLDHYHQLASLHHVIITLFDERDQDRVQRGEFLRATAKDIAETARTAGLDEAARVAVNEGLHFYPVAYRNDWLARKPGDLRSDWEALRAATVPNLTVGQADAPGIGGQSVVATARALQSRLFELYDIENAPDVVHTEDGPQYVVPDSEPDPRLTESIADVEKRLDDYLRSHREELESVAGFTAYYADQDRRAARLMSTPPDLREHTVSIGYDDEPPSFAPRWLPGPQLHAPDLTSAYAAAQTIIRFTPPGERIWLRISREVAVPGDGVTVAPETAHDLVGTAQEVLGKLAALREQHTSAEQGEVVNVIDNRIPLRQRIPQAHPDREAFVGWDRSTGSFFAQVIDGTDPDGEDVLTVDAGADTIGEITDPRRVIDMVRPYAAIPSDLLNRLTSQQRGRTSDEVPTTAARTRQHLTEPRATTPVAETDRQRIGRLLDSAAPSEPRPSTSAPPQQSPDTPASAGVLDVHSPHRGQGYELG